MNFELSEEHKVLQNVVSEFAKNELANYASEHDKEHTIKDNVINRMRELGFFGVYLPEKYGGAAMDVLSYIIVIEELSKVCASTGVLISAHTSLCCDPIYQFGTEDQKKEYLTKLTNGDKIGCILLTEPDAGSDVASISTNYKSEGDYYIINGSKLFVTNGAYRGIGVIFATKDRSLRHKGLSAFIIDLSSEGVELLKNEDKMGIRGTYTTAFAFNDLKVPKKNLLGNEGQGFKIAMETLNGGRIGIAAQAIGIAEGAFNKAFDYAKERKQFGKPLSSFQGIQFKFADMATKIETAKILIYKAAWLKDNDKTNAMESAMCKYYASEVARFVTNEALQIHGGYGYIEDYEVERMYRDAKITEIYEGTSEIQKIVISNMLFRGL
ncbi:MAG: acyl-CoA dehydrogenase family protein [Deferribacterota bacterium]|nr:acyl-CoA dehydrogenase family protein [Deferribacterota bacterium]